MESDVMRYIYFLNYVINLQFHGYITYFFCIYTHYYLFRNPLFLLLHFEHCVLEITYYQTHWYGFLRDIRRALYYCNYTV